MYRLYRFINNNPSYPEQNGSLVYVEDFGNYIEAVGNWWKSSSLDGVIAEAEYWRKFLELHGLDCDHIVGVYRGFTVEYVDVQRV